MCHDHFTKELRGKYFINYIRNYTSVWKKGQHITFT